jgi:hypothetical protein
VLLAQERTEALQQNEAKTSDETRDKRELLGSLEPKNEVAGAPVLKKPAAWSSNYTFLLSSFWEDF